MPDKLIDDDAALLASHKHVELMCDDPDGLIGMAPVWHGWALRDSFWAGVVWAREQAEQTEEKL